jgi:two-component system NtrC family sensor kinase
MKQLTVRQTEGETRRQDLHLEDPTQWALIHRPKFSIRTRIALGFSLTFILTCGITLAALLFIDTIGAKQSFLEKAGNYAFDIQQARRFEKDYFLYHTNLLDAINHIHSAQNLLENYQEEFRSIIGEHSFAGMLSNLIRYRELLEELESMDKAGDKFRNERLRSMESEIRRYGAEIVANASNTIDQERLRIHSWLETSKFVGVMALVLILLVVASIAAYITHQIIRPFGRFERYTQQIAAGDFSPIRPKRKFRDEFTNLALALNRMLRELKEREEQLIQSRKMAAIGALTAGIAHEINNPLNNISITIEALIDEFKEWTDEEKLEMLKDAFTQVERAAATVANLLDFTRRDETAFELLSINDVIRSTTNIVRNEVSLKNIRLALNLSDDLSLIRGNQHNLQQVFLNLFLNAIQAMPNGGELTVTSSRQDSAVQIDVGDTGDGIPEEILERIFDPFFTTKEVGKGTGLGLSVSFGIIEKHHGTIRVENRPGKGANFIVTLPAAETETM